MPGKDGGARNTAVVLKKFIPSLGSLILFGRAERKKVRTPPEITEEIVKNRRGKK